MNGKRLIEKIKLQNILSFGDKGEEITLEPLNIIIGQNASGKSNLVDVIKLLRSLPQNKGLANFISQNGGINEWMWKGKDTNGFAIVKTSISYIKEKINYEIIFKELLQRLQITDEFIEDEVNKIVFDRRKVKYKKDVHYEDSLISPNFEFKENNWGKIFLQRLLPIIKLYTDLQTNRNSSIRKPQLPDASNDFLEEDGSNLALVLNDLEHRGDTKDKITLCATLNRVAINEFIRVIYCTGLGYRVSGRIIDN